MNPFLDRLGISASLVCILHCLLTPILVMFAPLFGRSLSDWWFHAAVIVVVVPVAAWALWTGYRAHRRPRVLWLGALGVALIAGALVFEDLETPLMIGAGLVLASAHYFNLRVCAHAHHRH